MITNRKDRRFVCQLGIHGMSTQATVDALNAFSTEVRLERYKPWEVRQVWTEEGIRLRDYRSGLNATSKALIRKIRKQVYAIHTLARRLEVA